MPVPVPVPVPEIAAAVSYAPTDITVGGSDPTNRFLGELDDLRIYGYALSPDQLAAVAAGAPQ